MSVIFFGISSENHVRNSINRWISIAGAPAIFSERDDHIEKYQTKLLGKYDVVSIDDALARYPDADVWVTYAKVGYIADMLAKKMPPERVHFLEADLEYRKGCKYLGNFMLFREASFSPCCVAGQMPAIRVSGSFKQRLAVWQNYTTKLIDAINNGSPNKCQGCHMLMKGFWRKSVKLSMLSFASSNRGDACNFKCVYCYSKDSLERLKSVTEGLTVYERLQQLADIPYINTEDMILQLSNGEFTVNKHCDAMLDIILNSNWKLDLTSNCSVYREKLAELMERGRVTAIVTSLDAGTRETFKKIKGNDRFDIVVANLRKYPLEKTRLNVKYIFLEGINDNEAEVDSFYEIVKELGGIIMFSSDRNMPFTEKMRELALRMVLKAKADGVKINAGSNFLSSRDAKFLNDSYANA